MSKILQVVPTLSSHIPGFSLQGAAEKRLGESPFPNSAHDSLLKITITADGTSVLYPGKGSLPVYLHAVRPGEEHVATFADDGDCSFHMSVPADDVIRTVTLAVHHQDPDYAGLNLVLMSEQMGTRPYYELLVFPDETPVQ